MYQRVRGNNQIGMFRNMGGSEFPRITNNGHMITQSNSVKLVVVLFLRSRRHADNVMPVFPQSGKNRLPE